MDKEEPIYVINHSDNMSTEVFQNNNNYLTYVVKLNDDPIISFGGVGRRLKSINTTYFAYGKRNKNKEMEKLWSVEKRQQLVDFHKKYFNIL